MPEFSNLVFPDSGVTSTASVDSALSRVLTASQLDGAVKTPLGPGSLGPIWVTVPGVTYLVQRNRPTDGWVAVAATFDGCLSATSAASSFTSVPAPTQTDGPLTPFTLTPSVFRAVQDDPQIRAAFFPDQDLRQLAVLCGIDVLGTSGDDVYSWVECGAYTTGDAASEVSASAMPVVLHLDGHHQHGGLSGADIPRQAHLDADISALFPVVLIPTIETREVHPVPDSASRLATARTLSPADSSQRPVACDPSDLRLHPVQEGGAMGTLYATIRATNAGPACTLPTATKVTASSPDNPTLASLPPDPTAQQNPNIDHGDTVVLRLDLGNSASCVAGDDDPRVVLYIAVDGTALRVPGAGISRSSLDCTSLRRELEVLTTP